MHMRNGTGLDLAMSEEQNKRTTFLPVFLFFSFCLYIIKESQSTACRWWHLACAYAFLRPANGMRRLFRSYEKLSFFFSICQRSSRNPQLSLRSIRRRTQNRARSRCDSRGGTRKLGENRAKWSNELICINGSAYEHHIGDTCARSFLHIWI